METTAADFEPKKDQEQLRELIEAKAFGGEASTVAEREPSGDDGDESSST